MAAIHPRSVREPCAHRTRAGAPVRPRRPLNNGRPARGSPHPGWLRCRRRR